MKNFSRMKLLTVILLLAALLLSACAGIPAKEGAAPAESAAPAETAAPEETAFAPIPEADGDAAPSTDTQAPAAQTGKGSDALPEKAPAQVVEAATAEELLNAIAPDTQIRLTGRSYNLSHALGYGNFSGDWYDWQDCYEGYELVIRDISNFSIVAEKPGVEIVTDPHYANVIRFDGCSGVTLRGFTAGHSEGPGFCTGAVLHFDRCKDVLVENCELYGCGTYGLELERCSDFRCADTVIRNCTYGASSVNGSSRVLVEDCTVYEIENCYNGVFWFIGSSDCAVLNTLVRSCTGCCLMQSDYSTVSLLGCEIVRNSFEGMFSGQYYPITVEGCALTKNSLENGWYYEAWRNSERVADSEGKPWEDSALYEMKLQSDLTWQPTQPQETEPVGPVAPSEDGMIHVTNVDELLASIAPDVTIYLEDGVYDLSKARDFGGGTDGCYYWMSCYDGPGLVISGVKGLTITAGGPHRATITAVPRYADVIFFEDCEDLTLQNFTAGHTQEPSSCMGGVLSFQRCGKVTIQDCSLYGCGILGVSAYSSKDLTVRYTEIHDCSDGAFSLSGCDGVTIERCNIHDIPNYTYQLYDCKNVTADGKALGNGMSW